MNKQYNINMLPNELQYEILDRLSLQELRKGFLYIKDPHVSAYARRLGENFAYRKRIYESAKDDPQLLKWLLGQGDYIFGPEARRYEEFSNSLPLILWLHANCL